MTDLNALTALGAAKPRLALEIRENPDLALTSVALRRGAIEPTPLGMHLRGPGGWGAGQGVADFWVGPDQWTIEVEVRTEENFVADLKQTAPDCAMTGADR